MKKKWKLKMEIKGDNKVKKKKRRLMLIVDWREDHWKNGLWRRNKKICKIFFIEFAQYVRCVSSPWLNRYIIFSIEGREGGIWTVINYADVSVTILVLPNIKILK